MPPEFGRKWETVRFPLPAVCGIQRDADFIAISYNNFMYCLNYFFNNQKRLFIEENVQNDIKIK